MSEAFEYLSLEGYDSLDMDSSVASVWMLLNTPFNNNKIITIVEGQDDVEFYSHYFCLDCTIFYPDGNCDKHSVVLSALNGEYGSRILAIKDADFSRLNKTVDPFDNLFMTDCHDMEGMVLSNGLPDSFKLEYAEFLQEFEIDDIYSDLEQLSYLKWFNSRQSERLKFKGLSLYRFYSSSFSIDLKEYFEASKQITNNEVRWSLTDVSTFERNNKDIDKTQLYRGHDVFECLYIRAHKAARGKNLSKETFFRSLRNSYSKENFFESNLYAGLSRWADHKNLNLLIK